MPGALWCHCPCHRHCHIPQNAPCVSRRCWLLTYFHCGNSCWGSLPLFILECWTTCHVSWRILLQQSLFSRRVIGLWTSIIHPLWLYQGCRSIALFLTQSASKLRLSSFADFYHRPNTEPAQGDQKKSGIQKRVWEQWWICMAMAEQVQNCLGDVTSLLSL